jgi:hypothetical protein
LGIQRQYLFPRWKGDVKGSGATACANVGTESIRGQKCKIAEISSSLSKICSSSLKLALQLEEAIERPIIFLCASLGGIIVKRAISYSESRRGAKTSHLHSIYTSTYGLLFFGTPHHGSSKTHLLSSLTKLASLTPSRVLQTESALLNALEMESETLQNITDQFVPLMNRFRIVFYWETQKTDLGYTKEYIVDQTSAAPCMESTTSAGIAADHRGMCRFESKNDQGFRNVISELKRWSEEAPRSIGDRWVKSRQALRFQRRNEAEEMLSVEYGISERIKGDENLMIEGPGIHQGLWFGNETDRIETLESCVS